MQTNQSPKQLHPHGTTYRTFDTITYNLIGPVKPSISKSSPYVLTCMCLLTNFSILIPIPEKQIETVIQAYLQHIFGSSLTLETGGEF